MKKYPGLILIMMTCVIAGCASSGPCMDKLVGVEIDAHDEVSECFYQITRTEQDSKKKKLGMLCKQEVKLVLLIENKKQKENELLEKAWQDVLSKDHLVIPTGGVDKSGKVWHGGQIVNKQDENYFSVAVSTFEVEVSAKNTAINIESIYSVEKGCGRY